MNGEIEPNLYLRAPDDLLARRTAESRAQVEAALSMTDEGESAQEKVYTETRTITEMLGLDSEADAEIIDFPGTSVTEQN